MTLHNPFETEIALYEKACNPGDIKVLVSVPDFYHIALPNIGHQIIEHQINQLDGFFAFRCYLNHDLSLLQETNYEPDIIVISMSYEGSYIRAMRILDQLGLKLFARDRDEQMPLVVIGGRAVSMNPLPLFGIVDVIGIGDSDSLIQSICCAYQKSSGQRKKLFDSLAKLKGIIIPSRYQVETKDGYLKKWSALDAPTDIYPNRANTFPHSWYLSSETDYNDIGYYEGKTFFSIEIVKACRSSCLFCAEGFNNGRSRFTGDVEKISELAQWARERNADLIKLFFPAHVSLETTKAILKSLLNMGLSSRVGSTKAERIDREYIDLIGLSGQEKVAIAPETGDYKLRARLGKPGMSDDLLLKIVQQIIDAGIPNLDFYFIANLPGESPASFQKTIDFTGKFSLFLKARRFKGRFRISMPNFFPKAWTPFQFAPSGGIGEYLEKVEILERTFGASVEISSMKDSVDLLSQNIMARGGIEVSDLLFDVYLSLKAHEKQTGTFRSDTLEDWRKGIQNRGLSESQYFCKKGTDKPLPWHHIHLYENLHKLSNAWQVFSKKSKIIIAAPRK